MLRRKLNEIKTLYIQKCCQIGDISNILGMGLRIELKFTGSVEGDFGLAERYYVHSTTTDNTSTATTADATTTTTTTSKAIRTITSRNVEGILD